MDAPKSMGEYIGTVDRLRAGVVTVRPANPGLTLHNGDGFAFVGRDGGIVGFRGDVCEGITIRCKEVSGLKEGMRLYRNIDAEFERKLEADRPVREIGVTLQARLEAGALAVTAVTEDGREASVEVPAPFEAARDADRMLETVRAQLAKRSGIYAFSVAGVEADGPVPFMSASFLNGIRRDLASALDAQPVRRLPLRRGAVRPDPAPEALTYKDNPGDLPGAGERRHRGRI